MTVKYRTSFRTARRGDRKPAPPSAPTGPCRAAQMLALAHFLERKIASGEMKNHAHVARKLALSEGRVTQVMNLLLLSPAIQERLLSGELRCGERHLRRAASVAAWSEQEDSLSRRS